MRWTHVFNLTNVSTSHGFKLNFQILAPISNSFICKTKKTLTLSPHCLPLHAISYSPCCRFPLTIAPLSRLSAHHSNPNPTPPPSPLPSSGGFFVPKPHFLCPNPTSLAPLSISKKPHKFTFHYILLTLTLCLDKVILNL